MSSRGLHLLKPLWTSVQVQFEVCKEAGKGSNTEHSSYSLISRVILLFSRQRKISMTHEYCLGTAFGETTFCSRWWESHRPWYSAGTSRRLRCLYWENYFSSLSWRSEKILKNYKPSTTPINCTASFPSSINKYLGRSIALYVTLKLFPYLGPVVCEFRLQSRDFCFQGRWGSKKWVLPFAWEK